jgi:ATP-binding cassette, subfamily C (CFTR/MRP), member 4
LELEAA